MPFLLFFWKNPLGQKIGIVLICVILAFVALNWYGNSQYMKGKDVGVKAGAEDTRKSMEASWKVKEAEMAATQQKLDAERIKIDQDAAAVNQLRGAINSSLAQIRAANQTKQENSNAIVASVPGDQLDGAIRALSAKLGAPKPVTTTP